MSSAFTRSNSAGVVPDKTSAERELLRRLAEPRHQARSPSGRERLVRARIGYAGPPKRYKAPEHEDGVREQQQAAARAVCGEGRRRRQLGHLRGRRAL